MRSLFLMGLMLVLFSPYLPAYGHDIGISEASLSEMEQGRYLLSVKTPPQKSYLFAPPVLPEKCQISGNPAGGSGKLEKSFIFSCDPALRAGDSLLLPWQRDGIMINVSWLNGSEKQQLLRRQAGHIKLDLSEFEAGSGTTLETASRYLQLGIIHILEGADHLLFVLGLLLLVSGWLMLVKTITSFTLAHSITLGLATFGFINVPSAPVEAVIALSIVLLAVEVLRARQGIYGITYHFPWLIAFGFGLIHGLGFAGALSEIGLSQSEIPIALLFFNIGVEVGQLIFVAVVLMVVWQLKQIRFDRQDWIRIAPAYVIGTLATYWLFERISSIVLQA